MAAQKRVFPKFGLSPLRVSHGGFGNPRVLHRHQLGLGQLVKSKQQPRFDPLNLSPARPLSPSYDRAAVVAKRSVAGLLLSKYDVSEVLRSHLIRNVIRISIVLVLCIVCYLICERIDSIQLFEALFWKISFSVGGRGPFWIF